MDYRINVQDLTKREDLLKLVNAISEIAEELDILYTTTAPNGNITGRQGRKALYNNSGTYTFWVNTTGLQVWEQVSLQADGAAASTGVGSIKMGTANAANSAGFIKLKLADGTDAYVPYFTTDSP